MYRNACFFSFFLVFGQKNGFPLTALLCQKWTLAISFQSLSNFPSSIHRVVRDWKHGFSYPLYSLKTIICSASETSIIAEKLGRYFGVLQHVF